MLGDIDIVAILNTGVTGFAFLMLLVSFWLLRAVQSQVLGKPIESFTSIEFFREWHSMVRGQMVNTRHFMLLSAVFLFAALALLIYRPANSVTLALIPAEGVTVRVLHQNNEVVLDQNGAAMLRVKSEHTVMVRLDDLLRELDARTLEVRQLRDQLGTFVASTEALSSEVGF